MTNLNFSGFAIGTIAVRFDGDVTALDCVRRRAEEELPIVLLSYCRKSIICSLTQCESNHWDKNMTSRIPENDLSWVKKWRFENTHEWTSMVADGTKSATTVVLGCVKGNSLRITYSRIVIWDLQSEAAALFLSPQLERIPVNPKFNFREYFSYPQAEEETPVHEIRWRIQNKIFIRLCVHEIRSKNSAYQISVWHSVTYDLPNSAPNELPMTYDSRTSLTKESNI